MYKSNDQGKIEITTKVLDLFRKGQKNEMIYILFQAVDGQ